MPTRDRLLCRRLVLAVAAVGLAVGLGACADKVAEPKPFPQASVPAEAPPALPEAPAATPVEAPPPLVMPETEPALPAPPEAAAGPVRVALLLPLSGARGGLGRDMLDAAQLALFDLADDRFELLPRDTGGTPAGAATAAAAVLSEGASLILGPLLAGSVEAVAAAARAAGVRIVAFSTDRSVAGDGVFVMGFVPRAQIERVVGFARSKGLVRFAVLAPTTPYGVAVVNELREAAAMNFAVVTRVEYYDDPANDTGTVRRLASYASRRAKLVAQRLELKAKSDDAAKQALRRLKELETIGELDYEALLLPGGGERLLEIAPLLPYYDIDPARIRFLGTGQWDDPAIRGEPALIGGWFAAPAPAGRAGFEARYAKSYGHRPARLATLAYDGVALAAVLARDGGRLDTAALTAPNGFAGLDGIFRFRADGVVERGLAVLEVRRRGFRVVSPAPDSFLPPTN